MILLDLLGTQCNLLVVPLHILIAAVVEHLKHELVVGHRCVVLLRRHLGVEPLV